MTYQIDSFTDAEIVNIRTLSSQNKMLRFVNRGLHAELTQLQDSNRVLTARLSVLMSMLCDAGIRLPDDVQ